jgi:hypothetical protein
MAVRAVRTVAPAGTSRTAACAGGGEGDRDCQGEPREVQQRDRGVGRRQLETEQGEQEAADGAGGI